MEMSGTMHPDHDPSRRRFIGGLCAALATVAWRPGLASDAEPQELRFHHTHTGENLSIAYRDAGGYIPEALDELNRFLADFRTGESLPIDPGVFDIMRTVQDLTGGKGTYEIISAYRSPATNAELRSRSRGVAKRSLHMDGKAIDLRLTGVDLSRLRDAAWSLQSGGVGYYPKSNFVHIDTGRVRRW